MSRKISAVDARKNFGELLNRVSLMDEEIIIERAGKKIAKLVKLGSKKDKRGSGKLDFRKAVGLGADLWKGIDVEKYITSERENWD